MTTQHMDALSSFVYLIDNIPLWVAQIEALALHTVQKHDEFIAEYNSLTKDIKPMKKRPRSPSLHSIHSNRADAEYLQVTSDEMLEKDHIPVLDVSEQSAVTHVDPGIVNIILQTPRKRKPESLMRSGASGPPKYRTKRQIIIHYDSHVQNELEALVKTIGVARNNLRKGKNALTASKGFKLPPLGKRLQQANTVPFPEQYRSHSTPRNTTMLPKGRCAVPSSQRHPMSDDENSFIQTDKVLEIVQGLCETAAHQFLRDGDCKSELGSSIAYLKRVLDEARIIEVTLRKNAEAEKQLDLEQSDTENDKTIDVIHGIAPSDPNLKLDTLDRNKNGSETDRKFVDADLNMKLAAPIIISVPDISSLPTACIEIEVDDASDDSDLEVDITNFRMANARRITAC